MSPERPHWPFTRAAKDLPFSAPPFLPTTCFGRLCTNNACQSSCDIRSQHDYTTVTFTGILHTKLNTATPPIFTSLHAALSAAHFNFALPITFSDKLQFVKTHVQSLVNLSCKGYGQHNGWCRARRAFCRRKNSVTNRNPCICISSHYD